MYKYTWRYFKNKQKPSRLLVLPWLAIALAQAALFIWYIVSSIKAL